MPRALWSGSLSFGLVNIPVALVPATRDRDVRMRELDVRTGAPVSVKRVCTLEEREVPVEELAHGIEVEGQRVMLTDDELAAARPRKTDTIDIARFVDPAQIDPVLFDKAYWVISAGSAQGPLRAYKLLVQALDACGRAGTGETVIHNREHPVAIRAREERLMLHTLLFGHEVRSVKDLELPKLRTKAQAVERAVAIVQELSADFEPARYRDHHRQRLQALIESKREGREIQHAPEPVAPEPVPDLMGALEESLEKIRSSRPAKRGRSKPTPQPRKQGSST